MRQKGACASFVSQEANRDLFLGNNITSQINIYPSINPLDS